MPGAIWSVEINMPLLKNRKRWGSWYGARWRAGYSAASSNLTRKTRKDRGAPISTSRSTRDRAWKCVDVMREIAKAHKASVAQVALSWLLHQEVVTSVIIGVKNPEQLADNLGSVNVSLSKPRTIWRTWTR